MNSNVLSPLLLFRVPVFLLVLVLWVPTESTGQKIEIGASGGAFNYKGDLATQVNPRFFRPAGNLFFRYNLNKAVTFRTSVSAGQITAADRYASDPFQEQRDLSFRTRILELNVTTEYNFLDFQERRYALNWTPYLFGGVGYMAFNPSPKMGSYKTSGVVLPFGVGVKYQIRRPWSVGVELGARKTFSDYLDNLGDTQPSKLKLDQGDPSTKDMYYYLGLTISYTFYKLTCPE